MYVSTFGQILGEVGSRVKVEHIAPIVAFKRVSIFEKEGKFDELLHETSVAWSLMVGKLIEGPLFLAW